MNIIYVIEDYSENGGVERIVSDKANTLSTHYHHNVTLVSVYRDSRKELYKLDDNIRLIHLDVPFARKSGNLLLRLFSRIYTLLLANRRLNRTLRQLNPDIIFFATTLGAILLPFCRTKARKIFESHLARNFNPFNSLFFLTELTAERIVCLTSGDAKLYKHAKRVDIIPNYINNAALFVKDYGIRKAIAVGRLEHQKGFDILIDCWKEIASKYPDWQLDIYGEGSCHDALQQLIESLNLEGKVKLCGRNNNIMEVFPNYSVHLMTSRYEGLPMTLIEAQSCGLPSVVFNFQYGASDIVTNGHNGFVVEQGNSNDFVKAVMKMMSSEELRQTYGSNARTTVDRYSKDYIFSKWIELLNENT